MIKLSSKLGLIASYVKNGSIAADVGTDHGYIPVYLTENNICEKVIATDINKGPLNKAIESAKESGVSNKITFYLTDGLSDVPENAADTIIIAGMGGETIIGIMDKASWLKKSDIHLILQPQSKINELTKWLYSNGFFIFDASLVKEYGRVYIVLQVGYGKTAENDNNVILNILFNKKDPLFKEVLEKTIEKNEKIILNLKSSLNTEQEINEKESLILKLKKYKGEL